MTIEKKPFLPFSRPLIEEEDIREVTDTLRSGWLTTGPKTRQFEREFAAFVGAKHAIAVNSCTAALHLALEAVGIGEGDEVITTPMTFAATAEVIRYFNARPVFVDIDPVSMNMDLAELEKAVKAGVKGGRLKAILPVHFAGYPCNMDGIRALAGEFGLKVVEDAAHAFPAYYKDRIIGSNGDITCFSFYATKNITTGEGGMVATNNGEWAERIRVMSLHGISKDAWKRYTSEGNWYYEIVAPGYKYNLTDIASSLGLAQLRKAGRLWKGRREIALAYYEAFRDIPGIVPPAMPLEEGTRHSWHLYVIKIDSKRLSIDRNSFIEELKNRGIGTSVHFIPLHIQPYYSETYGYAPQDFPRAYEAYTKMLSLPIYPRMSAGDVTRVIEAVGEIARRNAR